MWLKFADTRSGYCAGLQLGCDDEEEGEGRKRRGWG